MRSIALALILLAPLASAALPPSVGRCIELGCARVADTDGDGAPDWANAAFTAGEQITVNANFDHGDLLWQADATTNELGGHDVEEALEEISVEPLIVTISLVGSADTDVCGLRGADALVEVYETDHESGEDTTIVRKYVVLP